ncbi:sigma-54-dependent transcriptional regulator [Alteriqipengyuania lutimaris]|uniref:Sigma-54-dependent Fis family transcriptional regulator n=1 Tax=Alteriqipengyuania lutimaris TaxID=1538146 RepID=A0A395LPM1_9SPHN|nr:sigma-54 dependent transcriptional regulator [Alteriqipengyuania lutimaris]MBB3032475.1 DNA-binding NtrC family response regulator [Alteriqipengyuania lutimaris]RDS78387.1 sigma-54-dependent Fis family transcriptional regulator [Alteriqipengyuania lutimaris]
MGASLFTPVRMTLVGAQHSVFRQAAHMARETGALVTMADDETAALDLLRRAGGDLVMIDVALDVRSFIANLRAERIVIPTIACGIDASAERAVAAVRGGARDYLPLPPDRDLIAAAIMSVASPPLEMVGSCKAIGEAIGFAKSMATSAAPMLIHGEPGTGKEVMARLIHAHSDRPGHFVTVECHGVAPEILESELFGHESGAFPGAVARRVGRLDEAEGGTIFLRGVEALVPALQARLLEVVQAADTCRNGASASACPGARLITSSSTDIRTLVDKGQFRADLLARLGLAEVRLPALRERGEDIMALARHFATHFSNLYDLSPREFDEEACRVLDAYSWPGNVRELEETVHRATLLARSGIIGPDALVHSNGARFEPVERNHDGSLPVQGLVGHTVAEVERELILHTLERCGGNRTSASSILGISVRTMRNKLKSFVQAGISVSPSH